MLWNVSWFQLPLTLVPREGRLFLMFVAVAAPQHSLWGPSAFPFVVGKIFMVPGFTISPCLLSALLQAAHANSRYQGEPCLVACQVKAAPLASSGFLGGSLPVPPDLSERGTAGSTHRLQVLGQTLLGHSSSPGSWWYAGRQFSSSPNPTECVTAAAEHQKWLPVASLDRRCLGLWWLPWPGHFALCSGWGWVPWGLGQWVIISCQACWVTCSPGAHWRAATRTAFTGQSRLLSVVSDVQTMQFYLFMCRF